MLRREAILSSRIEETIATPEQIALVELGAEPRTDDAREVGNFVWDFGRRRPWAPLCRGGRSAVSV